MEDILQGHEAHTGANGQAAAAQIVGLHRNSTRAKADDIAEGAHPCVVEAVPQGEARQAAADDEPAGDPFQERVSDAKCQHQPHLPRAELSQRGPDLRPMVFEEKDEDSGQNDQKHRREDGFLPGGCGVLAGLAHKNGSFLGLVSTFD